MLLIRTWMWCPTRGNWCFCSTMRPGRNDMSLILEHINKSFGQIQAISDLSLKVETGALFGFLGANGAGKTTTMRMILDIFRPDSGQIIWNGTPASEVARRVWGYLPEERGLYPQMEVADQLLFLARLHGLSK